MVVKTKKGSRGKGVALERKLKELTATLQRVQADFENFVKRAERERALAKERGFAEAMLKILPLLDSLNAAAENTAKAKSVSMEHVLKGFEELRRQALSIMREAGLREIECVGKPFNAELHEAVSLGSDESKQDNVVLEVLQRGYTLNGQVLRHAKVRVNRLGGD